MQCIEQQHEMHRTIYNLRRASYTHTLSNGIYLKYTFRGVPRIESNCGDAFYNVVRILESVVDRDLRARIAFMTMTLDAVYVCAEDVEKIFNLSPDLYYEVRAMDDNARKALRNLYDLGAYDAELYDDELSVRASNVAARIAYRIASTMPYNAAQFNQLLDDVAQRYVNDYVYLFPEENEKRTSFDAAGASLEDIKNALLATRYFRMLRKLISVK